MQPRPYSLGALINLITLFVGLCAGFYLGTAQEKVHAQATATPSASVNVDTGVSATAQQVEEVSPGITVGSIGTGLVLAHEINADSVVVNGYDLLKLHENTINVLFRNPLFNRAEIQQIIDKSRAPKVYRMKAPQAPKTTPKEDKKP